MIILTAGYPSSGKSLVCQMIEDKMPIKCFDPKDFYLPEHEKLNERDRKEMNIAAWEVCLENFYSEIRSGDNNVVIFDSCMANSNQFSHIVDMCKHHNKELFVLYIHSPVKMCKERHSEKMPNNVWDSYKDKLADIIPKFKDQSAQVFIIKNDKDKLDIDVTKVVSFLETRADEGS